MRGNLFRGAAVIAALSLAAPPLTSAQTAELTVQPEATTFTAEHLDALLAPVALYPDALLVQVLMASTFPLQVVEASRWLEEPGNKDLQGEALAQALENLNWDPSVKSLVPFPQVVATLEQPARMDAAAWLRVRDPAGRCDGVGPTAAASGAGSGHSDDNPTAACGRGERHDRHRTGKPEYRLRAGLQSDCRLWRLAKSGVSAGVYSAAGRLFAGQRGRWRICLWCRRGDRRLVVGMGASGVASRPRPRRRGSVQPYQREPGRDPVRGLASTAPCRGGPTFPSAGGAGRTATASHAASGEHLRLAECHGAWSSGAPLDGTRVPTAARSVDPAETAGRAPAGRYRAASRPPERRLPAALWIASAGRRVRHCARRCGEPNVPQRRRVPDV